MFYNYVINYGTKEQNYFQTIPELNYNKWTIKVFMDNAGIQGKWKRIKIGGKKLHMWVHDELTKNNFILQPQLTFPRTSLPFVEKQIQLALVVE